MPRFSKATVLLTLVAVCLTFAGPALADSPNGSTALKEQQSAQKRYLRIVRNEKGDPIALQTSIVRFVPASGEGDLVVDLIGAVHIGDGSYYNTLNKQFDQYDVVLYELVAPKGTVIPKGGRKNSDNPFSMVMEMAGKYLNLEWQTEAIDYTKKNFVHAESTEELQEAMRKRGEDGITLLLGITRDLLRQENLKAIEQKKRTPPKDHLADLDFFSLLLDPNASVKVKRMWAEQFDSEDMMGQLGGSGGTLNTILVTDRNKIAMKAFGKELAKGKKRIAIFYGAAHNPDFEQRLIKEYGLKIHSSHWMTAWDMKVRGEGMQELFTVPRR